jgi:acylphosphatase
LELPDGAVRVLFAATSALTLNHFVSRLDSAVPEDSAKSSKVEMSAAA